MNHYFYLVKNNEQLIIKLMNKGYETFTLSGHKKGITKISDTHFSLDEFINNLEIAFPFEYSQNKTIFNICQIGQFATLNDCLHYFNNNKSDFI